jgi:hypothetical protein
MKFVAILCLTGGALAAVGCADGPGVPTSPSAAAVSGLSAAPRSGDLHVTKECTEYTGLAGSFCTITSSNVQAIEVGSRVVYASAAGSAGLDSDVVLDPPGQGNNAAFGHCTLDAVISRCTFSGGTGKFTWFTASVEVSDLGGNNWGWDGTYSFGPGD